MKRIKNVAYIEDLGGIKTVDGKTINKKLLYRSAHLSEISEKEVDILKEEYHIDHVFDLRTDDEIKHRPEDFISPKIEYSHLSIVANEANPAVTKENRLQVLNSLINHPRGIKGHIKDLYLLLINPEQAKEAYRNIFKSLLSNDNKEGFLFHCTQGKDRTGITIYLILSALGVSEKRIEKLYLSFNNRARLTRFLYFIGMNIRFSLKKAIALNDTLTAKKIYFRTVVNEINIKYNGVINYLKEQIGLKEDDFEKLRQIYLI